MTPEERQEDAIDAVREWRNELRQQYDEMPTRFVRTGRRVWVDTGSGPGIEFDLPEGGEDRG